MPVPIATVTRRKSLTPARCIIEATEDPNRVPINSTDCFDLVLIISERFQNARMNVSTIKA
ncbi:hypothetical protein GACE_2299 [Geoglobus acetivorans]|uniref:Uncharacterized protein n=1 Tax=Geoglobus acetivorans TaxID=565033 RepID=A0A0A7GJG3_GEOAI|nr:hypothetical protein GACE_2299 [Geoglobus acetivorans]